MWNHTGTSGVSYPLLRFSPTNQAVPAGDVKLYKSPFWRDFVHLNVAMWTSNNALVPDPDKEDILASLPLDWPFLRLGLRMCGWGDNQIKYYLLGTPVIWYFSTISLGLAMGIAFWYTARMQRSYRDWAPGKLHPAGWCSGSGVQTLMGPGQFEHFLYVGKVALAGWAFHYRMSPPLQQCNIS